MITSSNAYLTEVRRLEEQKFKEGKNCWLKIVDFLIRYLSDDTLDSLLKKNDDIGLKKLVPKFELKLKENYIKYLSFLRCNSYVNIKEIFNLSHT